MGEDKTICPIRGIECYRSWCQWWLESGEDCAIKFIAWELIKRGPKE